MILPAEPPEARTVRVAYIVSRFPKVTETFIAREMNEVADRGIDVQLLALVRQRAPVVHPQAEPFLARCRFASAAPASVVVAQLHWLRYRPRAYLRLARWIGRGYARHPVLLVRAATAFAAGAWFARLVEHDRIEHVHAHWATYPALAALVVKQLTGVPFSVTVHAHDLYVAHPLLAERLDEAATIVTVSDYNRDQLRRLLPAEAAARVRVVRCGIDTSVFASPARTVTPALDLVCVGAFEDYKGHHVLVDACRRLVDAGLDVRCTFVGDGPRRRVVERMVDRAGLGAVITFAGATDEAGVVAALTSADIAVQPSLVTRSGKTEGIPNALMEAMAMELPVVGSDVTGMRELVVDGVTGRVVPPGDPDALARAVADLATAIGLRTEMGRAGRRRVDSLFNIHATGDAMAGVLTHRPTVSGGI